MTGAQCTIIKFNNKYEKVKEFVALCMKFFALALLLPACVMLDNVGCAFGSPTDIVSEHFHSISDFLMQGLSLI